jgi:hypothetical protein
MDIAVVAIGLPKYAPLRDLLRILLTVTTSFVAASLSSFMIPQILGDPWRFDGCFLKVGFLGLRIEDFVSYPTPLSYLLQ